MSVPAFSTNQYRRLVRASAWYDLLVTWPFALPWTFAWLLGLLAGVHAMLDLPGSVPAADTLHVLLANLVGSVVVAWALARIIQPTLLLGRLDALARWLFALWQVYAVLHGASAIVLGFTAFELLFGLLQLWRVADAKEGGA
ncbi:hypothetical protein [Comamonas terrae]|uniref:Short-chain dehydrogenase n=1 Tax=Comamonas terrae TaxID=673548 RepID=A0ABW5USS6_9BURK|nr:hypothetical protein [Comamonas terrae]